MDESSGVRVRSDHADPMPGTPRVAGTAQLMPVLTAGLLLGATEAVIAASFAALVFAGPLSDHLPAAVGLAMFGATAVLAVTSLLSSHRGTIASVQDIPAAVLALVAASVVVALPADSPEAFYTVVMVIALTSLVAGATFFLLGTFRLGVLVRFVPYPVLGGLLAGTGLLLVNGGMEVLTTTGLGLAEVRSLFRADTILRWLPAVGFALVLLGALRRGLRASAIPAVILAAIGVFYVVLAVGRVGVHAAGEAGWLLGPFPAGGLWRPWSVAAVGQADWGVVAGNAGSIGVLIVFAVIALLLNASGIELTVDRDLDLDQELRAAGAANLLSGAGGGFPGYHAVSLTALAHNVQGHSRYAGVVAAGVCAVMMVFGASVLALFPRPVLGGLLVFMGLDLVATWLVDSRRRLPGSEYAVILLIVAFMVGFGFFVGVGVGLAAAIVVFVVNYGRSDVVKHTLTGASFRSRRDRSEAHRESLHHAGPSLEILELQGYLFFGTSHQLFERIRRRVTDGGAPRVGFLILDFRRVTDLDSSAVVSFEKIDRLCRAQDIRLVYTSLSERLRRRLEQGPLAGDVGERAEVFADLDDGLEWCEDRLLESHGLGAETSPDGVLWDRLRADLGDEGLASLRRHLRRLDVPGGTELIAQGEGSRDLYFLESGEITVRRSGGGLGPVRLRTMGPGAIVGEMSLYLDTPRVATVTTECDSVIHLLGPDALAELEDADPAAVACLHRMLARILAERLAATLSTAEALLD